MALFSRFKRNKIKQRLNIKGRKERYHHLEYFEGGLSLVSKSFDRSLDRIVAIKALKEKYMENGSMLKAFLNEAKLIGYLDHPGVISIYDVFIQGNASPCYIMEFIKGRNLDEYIDGRMRSRVADGKQNIGIPLTESLRIFERICETMAYAHDRGVVHLDLKPENIIIGAYGEVLIIDWGSALLYDTEPYRQYIKKRSANDESVSFFIDTEKAPATASPMYMSPEQTQQPRETLDPLSDIFSAGVVLYQMLTGVMPFTGIELDEVWKKIQCYCPPTVHTVNSDIPLYLSQICSKMIEKKPDARYRSFHDVLGDLKELRDSGHLFATKRYKAGDVVFREGEEGSYSFIILSGKVDISKKVGERHVSIAELGKNEIVGELAIFSNEPRSATVTAIEPTTIRIMTRKEIDYELEKLAPWVGNMVSGLSDRFIELNERLLTRMGDESFSGV